MKAKTTEIMMAFMGTLIFLIIIVPVFLIWIPRKIILSPELNHFFDIGPFRYLGVVPIVLGVIIYIFCSCSFIFIGKGTPIPFTPTKELIVTGFYRFVRNPLYVAGVFVLAGEALLFQSMGILIYCVVMFGVFNLHILMEEALLSETFGTAYERYRNSVPRWIPRLKPYKGNDSESQ